MWLIYYKKKVVGGLLKYRYSVLIPINGGLKCQQQVFLRAEALQILFIG